MGTVSQRYLRTLLQHRILVCCIWTTYRCFETAGIAIALLKILPCFYQYLKSLACPCHQRKYEKSLLRKGGRVPIYCSRSGKHSIVKTAKCQKSNSVNLKIVYLITDAMKSRFYHKFANQRYFTKQSLTRKVPSKIGTLLFT